MHDVVIRPMREEDVVGADRVCLDVLYTTFSGEEEAVRAARQHARIRHLLDTDPGGSWVAEHDGRVAGVGLALIREGVWGFSLFGVAQELQGTRRRSRSCSRAAGTYGAGARGHLILSSTNPQAMGIYAHTGLPIRPCVAAAGIPDVSRAPVGGRRRRRGRGGDRGGRRHRPRSCAARATGATCRCRWPTGRGCWCSRTAPSPWRAGARSSCSARATSRPPSGCCGRCSSAGRRAPP